MRNAVSYLLGAILAMSTTACPPPPPSDLCGRKAEDGTMIEETDCPSGFECDYEPAPAGSGDGEWGVCRALDGGVSDAAVVQDASADAGVADLVGQDTSATPDAARADTLMADTSLPDTAGPCAIQQPCQPAEVCEDVDDGGYRCLCNGVECQGTTTCVAAMSGDAGMGGEPACCETGELNCGGGSCVDPQSDPTNCGGCGVTCSGLGGLACVTGRCSCSVDAGAASCTPADDAGHVASVTCEADDAGVGVCNYECQQDWGDCDDNPLTCEADLRSSPDHCGDCDSPALQLDPTHGVPLSSQCVDGVPACGAGPACVGQVCIGAEGDPPNAACVDCVSEAAVFCGGGGCCNHSCVPLLQLDANCGCGVDGPDGSDCAGFSLGGPSGTALHGKVCVNPAAGVAVSGTTLHLGVCGCLVSGDEQCGSVGYDNDGQSVAPITLVGLCDAADNTCEPQNVTACGTVGGVVAADSSMHVGAVCDPYLGGPLCEDNLLSDGFGECGCGSFTGNPNNLCKARVLGADAREHSVADTCGGGACVCFGAPTDVACAPDSASPDCCDDGCVNLDSDANHCGQCGEVCVYTDATQSDACGASAGLEPGQCACNSSGGSCPAGGGGGGGLCVNGGCVCTNNAAQPCPTGTWCVGGNYALGQGSGCCAKNTTNGTNRCPVVPEATCAASTPVLCVNSDAIGTKWACCAEGSPCGVDGSGDVVCQ